MEGEQCIDDPLIIVATEAVTQLHLQHQDARRVLHDNRLSSFLAEQVKILGNLAQTNADELLVSRIAGLFYPLRFRANSTGNGPASQAQMRAFLLAQEASAELITRVEVCIAEVLAKRPQAMAARLLADALIGTYANSETQGWADLRKLEQALLEGPSDRLQQAQLQLQELLSIRYSTTVGQQYWQGLIGQQLIEQKKRVEKLIRDQGQASSSLSENEEATFVLENGVPVRAAQTYFRTVYRNHINLSAIADNKANIMISVNSILISVLITFLSYRNIAETQPMILLPVVIFLMTGLASLIFAVLSARPKVTQLKNESQVAGTRTKGLAFFGNFIQLSLADFEVAMDEQLKSSHLLYGSMVEDLYHLGKVLDKKYRSLSISYNIFMLGLIVTVVLFLITLFAN